MEPRRKAGMRIIEETCIRVSHNQQTDMNRCKHTGRGGGRMECRGVTGGRMERVADQAWERVGLAAHKLYTKHMTHTHTHKEVPSS